MTRFVAIATLALIVAVSQPRAQQPGVAYLAIDLKSNVPIAGERLDRIDLPVAPGSVMKIVTLAAALESGAITPDTGIICTRQITVAGHPLSCTHPDLHRPLRPAEALAHSCNVYFATAASQLSRTAFDRALADLGLPPSDPARPLAAAALGLEGVRVSPRRLLAMLARVSSEPSSLPWRAGTLALLRDGLAGAARFGTASALSEHGIDALAKTGTVMANGVSQGIVVGVTPSASPTTGFVLLASGVAGMDAAALAADRLKPSNKPAAAPVSLRIGIAQPSGGYAIRTMPLEDYVAGVVAGEAARDMSPRALEALAITVRTFALANRQRHKADGFDLCDLTHCQALRTPSASSDRAARATAGRVLLSEGVPAQVFYTASCGGYSERPSAVWPGAADPPFLLAHPDEACEGQPEWTSELRVEEIMRALRAGGFKGDRLRDIQAAARTSSHRVRWLALDGFVPHEISGEDFRTLVGRTLGWQYVRSTAFEIHRTGSGFRIDGHGAGHGVGLCVTGAARLGERGESAEAILSTYFPGLSVSPPNERLESSTVMAVSLPAADQGQRAAIQSLAVRVMADLAVTLQVNAPSRVELLFHPTIESYQRETGQPWFTAAATRGAQVQLIPLSVLRRNDGLEPALHHEFVHVLTWPALHGRPLWVIEGVAKYFDGSERPAVSATGSSCPADREFTHPASEAALQFAYERATTCVARALTAGTKWTDLK